MAGVAGGEEITYLIGVSLMASRRRPARGVASMASLGVASASAAGVA